MDRVILHIDFDSFFASVEQQYNPRLRGVPVGVTATNGTPIGACIIASSREAKRRGIKTGSRTFEAYQKCPELKLVPADFVKYFEVSKKFLRICSNYSPYVEMFSIDEVFMDVTQTVHLFGDVNSVITKIKQQIAKEIGEYITASAGISHNKLLAKLASGLKKPNGVFEIRKEDIQKVYASAKLTDMCGIGERVKLRLNKIGVYTLLQLRAANLMHLVKEFGNAEGAFLHNIGQGMDENPVISYTNSVSVKSVGRNYCLPKNEYNKRLVLQNIYELSEEVGIKLRKLQKEAKTIGVSFRGNIAIGGQKTLGEYMDTGNKIFSSCLLFMGNDFMIRPTDYIRQISIWASHLKDRTNKQLSLFENTIRDQRLMQAVDLINEKFGDHTIRNGFLLYSDKLTTVPNGYGADKWERTKLAASNL